MSAAWANAGVEPADEAVEQALGKYPSGLSALALVNLLVEGGLSLVGAQRAIQRAIDAGSVAVGEKLALRLKERA